MATQVLKKKMVDGVAVVVLLLLFMAKATAGVPWWPFVLLFVLWVLITIAGSFFIRWNYHFRSLHCNRDVTSRHIAITFDDGPHPEFTPKVLELLERYGSKGSFFCIGRNVAEHPEIVKRILAKGHTLGNHTYTHTPFFGFLSTTRVISELERTHHLIASVTGKGLLLYRPAYGVTNPMIAKAVSHLGLHSIGWNVRSFDTTALSENALYSRVTQGLVPGDIILLHDTSQKTVRVLERLLLFLHDNNLRSVPVDRLLGIKAYE